MAETDIEAPQHELTTAGSHTAVRRGYANGKIIEPGDPVPADLPVSRIRIESGYTLGWMAPADEAAEVMAELAD